MTEWINPNQIIRTMKPTGASFARGSSKQDYATPADFRSAVVKKFGMPVYDLAADDSNHFGPFWISAETDSLKVNWSELGSSLSWLNPPFDRIEPWAEKCHLEAELGAQILLLVPASVGAVWYAKHVHGVARDVYFLSPRLCFDGKAPYPKDCLLAHFNCKHADTVILTRYDCWRWRT